MNTRKCLVLNCTERFSNDRDDVVYFNFPVDEEKRKEWLASCGREVTYDSSQSAVCSRHFCSDDFELILKNNYLIRSLKKGVVPHINVVPIKQEPLDSDDHESECPPSSSTNPPDAGVTKSEADSSFFEIPGPTENEPNAEIPVERLPPSPSGPVINSVSSVGTVPAPACLPASQNWPGPYDFALSFHSQKKTTKGVSWTYSKLKDKLYVGKDAPCPINFSAKLGTFDGVFIRATALYTSPEHASEVVRRCVNHSMPEASKGVSEAEHLVRCESIGATYEMDRSTERHSVVVPFENPPAGQLYSTYLYKFTCFGSCAGGPNRRPLMLIFSLEKGGKVIGRRKLDVKICACPGRDRMAEEKQILADRQPHLPLKRKINQDTSVLPSGPTTLDQVFQFTKNIAIPPTKKTKPNNSGVYHLNVHDPDCYEFLKQMKKFFEMCKTVINLPPPIKSLLLNPSRYRNGKKCSDPETEEGESDQ